MRSWFPPIGTISQYRQYYTRVHSKNCPKLCRPTFMLLQIRVCYKYLYVQIFKFLGKWQHCSLWPLKLSYFSYHDLCTLDRNNSSAWFRKRERITHILSISTCNMCSVVLSFSPSPPPDLWIAELTYCKAVLLHIPPSKISRD